MLLSDFPALMPYLFARKKMARGPVSSPVSRFVGPSAIAFAIPFAIVAALILTGAAATAARAQQPARQVIAHRHAEVKAAASAAGESPLGESSLGQSPILDAMTSELDRAFKSLGHSAEPQVKPASTKPTVEDKQLPPYFLSYTVRDTEYATVTAQYGALVGSSQQHMRLADVQMRVGSPELDNTHGQHRSTAVNTKQLPLTDDREALMRSLWMATNEGYGNAIDNFLRVKTEQQVRAKEEDTSGDFSQEPPQVHIDKPAPQLKVDRAAWEQRVRSLSTVFRDYPDVYQNEVMFAVQSGTDYYVSSEGSRLVMPQLSAGVVVLAATRAEDGMDLTLSQVFQAATADGLPSQTEMEKSIRELAQRL